MTSTVDIPARPADTAAPAEQPRRIGHGAILHALELDTTVVELPGLGTVRLPPPDTLAWLGGVVTLAALGLLEWPVAAVIGTGHLLAHQHHLQVLHAFGEALESA